METISNIESPFSRGQVSKSEMVRPIRQAQGKQGRLTILSKVEGQIRISKYKIQNEIASLRSQ